jgi:hypothetical protein
MWLIAFSLQTSKSLYERLFDVEMLRYWQLKFCTWHYHYVCVWKDRSRMYWFIYYLYATCSTVLLQDITLPRLVTFPALYRSRRSITAFTRKKRMVPLLSQMNPVNYRPPYFSKIHHISIIFPSTPTSPKRFFRSGFPTKPHKDFSPARAAGSYLTSFLIMLYSPASCCFSFYVTKIFHSTLFSNALCLSDIIHYMHYSNNHVNTSTNAYTAFKTDEQTITLLCSFLGVCKWPTLSLCYFLDVRDQTSHPYKKTSVAMVQYYVPSFVKIGQMVKTLKLADTQTSW